MARQSWTLVRTITLLLILCTAASTAGLRGPARAGPLAAPIPAPPQAGAGPATPEAIVHTWTQTTRAD